MSEKDSQTTVTPPPTGEQKDQALMSARQRVRGSGPILILAVLFVAATFLAWYFTWFGRGLSDADISKYLVDEKNPRHVQHALVQVQQRLDRGDPGVKQWYPQLITLSKSQETEFRLTVAWLMGFDNKSEGFHQALTQLVRDPQPIVRRNAALALVRFNDDSGRQEFLAILKPFEMISPANGTIASTLKDGSEVARGTLLARLQTGDGKIAELRSPLPGRINSVSKGNGSTVVAGDVVLTLNSDEDSVWEALRALSIVGKPEDAQAIQSYGDSSSGKIREQASLTVQSIQRRTK